MAETKRAYNMKPKRPFAMCVCASATSMFLILSGIVLFFVWPMLFDYLITSNLVMERGGHTYELWQKFPALFSLDFYFFNWTNPHELYNNKTKMKFRELGPYRFMETKEKANITWNENGTIRYRHLKYWFEDAASKSDLDDLITTVNPVALAASHTARDWNFFLKKGLSLALSSNMPNISLTKSARQLLFEGYPDPLLTLAKSMPFGTTLPPWDRFGWFYSRNGSEAYEGLFEMGTGLGGTQLGRLYSWNYNDQSPFFSPACSQLEGSAGEFFPSKLSPTSISFFSPDLCRTVLLDFVGEEIVDDILGYKFVLGHRMLDNGTDYPENACYCNGECMPSGVLNVSSCRYNSPSFGSLPHFYLADPYYTNAVEGLRPDKSKHEFSIILEPLTGLPLQVNARLQLNLLMKSIPDISLFAKVPRVYVPMLWFEQTVRMPSNEAFFLRLLLNLPLICTWLAIILVASGLAVVSYICYRICTVNLCAERKNDTYLYAEQRVPLQIHHPAQLVKIPKSQADTS